MSTITTLDVSALPSAAFGKRNPVWWGTVLLALIEGTTFAIMFVAYLYVRGNFDVWPPSGRIHPAPGITLLATLTASLVPMWLCRKAALDFDLGRTRLWLLAGTILSVVAIPLRIWEIAALPFLWDENAYASIVWSTIGLHCIEGAAGVLENVLLTVLLFTGPVEKKHFGDIEANVLFWAFIVLVWWPFALLFMIDGAIR